MIIFQVLPYLLFVFVIVAMVLAFKEIFKPSKKKSKSPRKNRSEGHASQFDDMLKSGMIDKKEYDELKKRYG